MLAWASKPWRSRSAVPAQTHTERFVLNARTEVTAWMLILGDRHLPSILAEYGPATMGRPIAAASSGRRVPATPLIGLSPGAIKRRAVLGV